MDSDKNLLVRLDGEQKSLQIVSLATGAVTARFPMPAESAILSPDGKTIAVRAGAALQIYNMELQSKIKAHKMADDAVPVFWNWVRCVVPRLPAGARVGGGRWARARAPAPARRA